MADLQNLSNLASLPLRRLREVARRLGISRYGTQAREGLVQAIESRSPATSSPQAAPAPITEPTDTSTVVVSRGAE
ncbi:MAG: DUF4912 domain-containing protein, partial [Cyanobacteriota bacterium]